MNIRKDIVVHRSVKEVWEVLGTQFEDAYKWARGLDSSTGHGKSSFEGLAHSNRTCEVPGFGKIDEVILIFDPVNHILSYEVKEGFPTFISSAVNTWILKKEDLGTRVSMNLEMQTTGIKGVLIGPMMKMNLNKLITGVVSDFKVYVETGKPSKHKAKELAKEAKKAA